MNKVSLKKIRHLLLGGNVWLTLGNLLLQGATGGFGLYLYNNLVINPITYPYNSPLYPNPIASQGSLNSTPLNTNFSPLILLQFLKLQESLTLANIDLYRLKQLAKKQSATKIGGMIGTAADMISGVLPINAVYNGSEGLLAHGFDSLGKSASDMVMKVNPMVGGIMKGAMALGQGLSAIGLGTDGMTKQDAILNSNLMNVTPLGIINAAFGKRSHLFTINLDTIKSVGSDYDDTIGDIYDAKSKANKKYGLFSTHARHKANRFIDATNTRLNTMTNISDNARRVLAQSSDANALRFNMTQNGGINLQYLRIAKLGTKLPKIKEKIKWQPVITIDNPIKLEKGGKTIRTLELLIAYAKELNPRFILRMSEPLRYITLPNGLKATHKMSWGTSDFGNGELPFIYSEILEDDNGELKDFGKDAMKRAILKKNYLLVNNPEEAELFTNSKDLEHGYKSGWKDFFKPFYKDGGNITILVTVVKDKPKENEAKNVIPAGALHANKHHMDNADSLTQKGIPVVDDKGKLQAEIEKDEIILHLKLTNKLEELQEKYEKASKTEQDKLAIEAGKLLVEEILHNTIDNTNLIDKCEKGGKINGSI